MEPQPIYNLNQPRESVPIRPLTEENENLDMLSFTNRFSIRQRISMNEALSGCEQNHLFDIATQNQKFIWIAEEKNNGCQRNCVPQENKKVDLTITDQFGKAVFQMKREYGCSFLCFKRNPVNVFLITNGESKKIGTITDNWELFNYSYTISDSSNNGIFKIKGGCCQFGLTCPGFPAEKCSHAVFNIFDIRDSKSEPKGKISKKNSHFWNEESTQEKLDSTIFFDQNLTLENKILLLAALISFETEVFAYKGGA